MLVSMIEDANNSILTLQSDLVVQQDLVAEWIVRAIRNDFSNTNLSDTDLSYADLSGADMTGVNWNWATCPDGTAAYYHGQTCENNL